MAFAGIFFSAHQGDFPAVSQTYLQPIKSLPEFFRFRNSAVKCFAVCIAISGIGRLAADFITHEDIFQTRVLDGGLNVTFVELRDVARVWCGPDVHHHLNRLAGQQIQKGCHIVI